MINKDKLKKYPEKEEENDMKLIGERHVFEKKDILKSPGEERMDYYPIAASEGALTEEEREYAGRFCEEEDFDRAVAEYAGLRLKPDKSIRFSRKKELYRSWRPSAGVLWSSISAAVVAVILITIYFTGKLEQNPEATLAAGQFTVYPDIPLKTTLPYEELAVIENVLPPPSLKTLSSSVPDKNHSDGSYHGKEVQKKPLEALAVIPVDPEKTVIVMEILPAGPDEILYLPYEFEKEVVKSPFIAGGEERVRQFSSKLEETDNILAHIIQAGRMVSARLKNKNGEEL